MFKFVDLLTDDVGSGSQRSLRFRFRKSYVDQPFPVSRQS